jgi:hypothetical protein
MQSISACTNCLLYKRMMKIEMPTESKEKWMSELTFSNNFGREPPLHPLHLLDQAVKETNCYDLCQAWE